MIRTQCPDTADGLSATFLGITGQDTIPPLGGSVRVSGCPPEKKRNPNQRPKAKIPSGQAKDFDRRNLETAWEILDNPEAHGGPDAFPSIWARLVLARLEQRRAA